MKRVISKKVTKKEKNHTLISLASKCKFTGMPKHSYDKPNFLKVKALKNLCNGCGTPILINNTICSSCEFHIDHKCSGY